MKAWLSIALALVCTAALAVSANANLLTNGGFDTGDYSGWTVIGTPSPDPPYPSGADFFGVISPDGSPYIGGAVASGGTKNTVIAQHISLPNTPGVLTISFWGWTRDQNGGTPPTLGGQVDDYSQLGYDPSGGMDPNSSNVIWSDKVFADSAWEPEWISVPNTPGGTGTVFVKTFHLYGIQWNATYFDNVQANVGPGPALPNFANGDFEITQSPLQASLTPTPDRFQTASPWVRFGKVGEGLATARGGFDASGNAVDGTYIGGFPSGVIGPYAAKGLPNWHGVRAQSGSYFLGSLGSYDAKNGGFYCSLAAVNGQPYTFGGYIDTVAQGSPSEADDDRVWIGIDPTGGIDPNGSTVVWNPDAERTGSNVANQWTPTSVTAVAASNTITLFVKFEQKFALALNLTAADNFTLQGPSGPTNVGSIGEAKEKPDFAYVTFTNPSIVTLVPISETGFFYAQDSDGTSGIRVDYNGTPPNVGDAVTLSGSLGTETDGERVLRASSVTPAGTGTTKVRIVGNNAFGGAGYVAPDGGSNLTTGLSNQGLLMQVYGKVTYVDFANSVWYLDDGSNVYSGALDFSNNPIPGIKVINSGVFPNTGDYVSMTGVVSSEIDNSKQIRVLRGRDGTIASDFNTLAP